MSKKMIQECTHSRIRTTTFMPQYRNIMPLYGKVSQQRH